MMIDFTGSGTFRLQGLTLSYVGSDPAGNILVNSGSLEMEDCLLQGATLSSSGKHMTPAMPLIFALDFQLDRILAEGLDARFARHTAMSKKVQDWCMAHGMEPLAKPEYRSRTVVTVKNDLKWDISALNKFLKTRDMRIANGYGKLKDLSFRVATMGETSLKDIDMLLEGFADFMKQ